MCKYYWSILFLFIFIENCLQIFVILLYSSCILICYPLKSSKVISGRRKNIISALRKEKEKVVLVIIRSVPRENANSRLHHDIIKPIHCPVNVGTKKKLRIMFCHWHYSFKKG